MLLDDRAVLIFVNGVSFVNGSGQEGRILHAVQRVVPRVPDSGLPIVEVRSSPLGLEGDWEQRSPDRDLLVRWLEEGSAAGSWSVQVSREEDGGELRRAFDLDLKDDDVGAFHDLVRDHFPKTDRELFELLVELDGRFLRTCTSTELQRDPRLIALAMRTWFGAIQFLPETDVRRNDEALFRAAILEGACGTEVPHLRNFVQHLFGKSFSFYWPAARSKLAGDTLLGWAGPDLRANADFVLFTILQCGAYNFRFAADSLRSNREFVIKCVELDKNVLGHVVELYPQFGDDATVLRAALRDVAGVSGLRASSGDPEIQLVPTVLRYASSRLRWDMNFVLEMVRAEGEVALAEVPEEVRKDIRRVAIARGYNVSEQMEEVSEQEHIAVGIGTVNIGRWNSQHWRAILKWSPYRYRELPAADKPTPPVLKQSSRPGTFF